MAPIGIPSRSLKFAIAFRAFVITGFCPVIVESSSTAESRSLTFCSASPRPMLRTIFSSRGTWNGLLQPISFMSAGRISLP